MYWIASAVSLPFAPHPAWPAHLLEGFEQLTTEQVQCSLAELGPIVPKLSREFLEGVCLPLSGWIASQADDQQKVIAVGGPPGSGKSTLTRALEHLLRRLYGTAAVGFSLDDVYYTKAHRLALARDVHPLLAIRGVPGSHDLALAHELLDDLSTAGPDRVVLLPRFDKLADDRAPEAEWRRVDFRPRVVFVDAWFWGAAPGPESSLEQPVNAREAKQDPDGSWRRYVHRQLKGPYARLFTRARHFLRLDSPSWQTTLDWRVQQQLDLLGSSAAPSPHERARISYFLELFERVARLPSSSEPDLVLHLDERHELATLAGTALLVP